MPVNSVGKLVCRMIKNRSQTSNIESLVEFTSSEKILLTVITCLRVVTNLFDIVGLATVALLATLLSSYPMLPNSGWARDALIYIGFSEEVSEENLVAIASLAAGFFIMKSIFSALLIRKTIFALARQENRISGEILYQWIDSTSTGMSDETSKEKTIYALMHSLNMLVSKRTSALITIFAEACFLIILLAVLFVYAPMITTSLALYFLLVSFVLQRLVLGKIKEKSSRSVTFWLESSSKISDTINLFPIISVNGQRRKFINLILLKRRQTISVVSEIDYLVTLPRYAIEASLYIGIVIATLALLLFEPESAIEKLAIFFVAATRIVPSLLPLQQSITNFQTASAQGGPARDFIKSVETGFLDKMSYIKNAPNISRKREDLSSSIISLNNVSYSVNGSQILNRICLEIPKGKTTSLIGPSGSGKSTTLEIILGIKHPTEGEVIVNSNRPHLSIDVGLPNAAYIPQQTQLIEGTLRENLILPQSEDTNITDPDIWEMLTKLGLADRLLISNLGLDQPISSSTTSLSGGELQRIGVARALLAKPDLLILDEATSALDAESERIVQLLIQNYSEGHTVLAVAHRMATVVSSDLIVMLENGEVIESGSYQDLVESSKEFRELLSDFI